MPGWTTRRGAQSLLLVSPEGIDAAAIEYKERRRPVRSIDDLVIHRARSAGADIGDVELVVTDEGEYGALITVTGTHGGRDVQRDCGFVFGDDFYSQLFGFTARRELFARSTEIVRQLVKTTCQWLGVRRRLVLYRAPPGWHGVVEGCLEAHWYAPEFPRDPSRIVVWPAVPVRGTTPEAMFQRLAMDEETTGFHTEQVLDPEERATRAGLPMICWQLHGAGAGNTPMVREIAIGVDDHYLYVFRLHAIVGEHVAAATRAFRELLATVHPIPAPPADDTQSDVLVSHWVD